MAPIRPRVSAELIEALRAYVAETIEIRDEMEKEEKGSDEENEEIIRLSIEIDDVSDLLNRLEDF